MRRVGDYEVLGKIGEGGMGVVYRARRRDACARTMCSLEDVGGGVRPPSPSELVALKLLHPRNREDIERRARFLREAQLAATIRHPAVVTVHDFGEAHLEGMQRSLFLVQELVPGRDLYYRAEIEGLPPAAVVAALAQVVEGLAAAHAVGVVHRDVKPGNVLVAGDGSAKLLDFGLARRIDEAADQDTEPLRALLARGSLSSEALGRGLDFRTAVGTSLGTAGYSAPEQLEGARPHPSADLYSIGVSLYQLLGGRMPYRADTLSELRAAVQKPPPTLEELGVRAPEGFSDYVASLLASSPDHRPAAASEVAAALREYAAQWPEETPIGDELTETGIRRLRSWLGEKVGTAMGRGTA
ncbi:MAG: serine/threonine protein kinase [Acidobacteria bacterium]|nr:MAG: serine/threonine protein kinase [Acidobacteriota bacterium]REK04531.1 MAG: serine/threonine protein kinase [Acidobacteriota bacterium]